MLAGAKLPVLKNHYVSNLDDETRVLTSESVSMTHSLYLRNLKNCDITVDTTVTKVLVEDCVGTTLRLKRGSLHRFWKSGDLLTLKSSGHVQEPRIFYTTKDHFGSLVWAKSEEVNLHFGDYTDQEELDASGCFSTGLARFTAANPQMDIWPDIDQFIVRFLKSKLQAEVVIRVGGGYATTDREDGEANKRKEAILEKVGEIFFKKVDFKSLESYVKTKAKEQDDEKKRRINDAEEERKRRKLDSASQDKPAPESNPSLN
ncbi:hypothetical protein BC829DRAFT_268874 [Chytridium lagenaria]|nr:hypothetical protein BC829DRAFT_268874 [Chytridium lagenaria]